MVDLEGVSWCGDPKKGILWEDPKKPDELCPYNPVQLYWKQASIDVSWFQHKMLLTMHTPERFILQIKNQNDDPTFHHTQCQELNIKTF